MKPFFKVIKDGDVDILAFVEFDTGISTLTIVVGKYGVTGKVCLEFDDDKKLEGAFADERAILQTSRDLGAQLKVFLNDPIPTNN